MPLPNHFLAKTKIMFWYSMVKYTISWICAATLKKKVWFLKHIPTPKFYWRNTSVTKKNVWRNSWVSLPLPFLTKETTLFSLLEIALESSLCTFIKTKNKFYLLVNSKPSWPLTSKKTSTIRCFFNTCNSITYPANNASSKMHRSLNRDIMQ